MDNQTDYGQNKERGEKTVQKTGIPLLKFPSESFFKAYIEVEELFYVAKNGIFQEFSKEIFLKWGSYIPIVCGEIPPRGNHHEIYLRFCRFLCNFAAESL